jgi:peptide chain release factor
MFRRLLSFSRILLKLPDSPPLVKVNLNETDLEERFIRGSGNGGQKINKNMSCVQLKHLPTGLMVETQRFRELVNNRKEARKLLILKLDLLLNGPNSKIMIKEQKIKKSKAKQKKRSQKKYGDGEDKT